MPILSNFPSGISDSVQQDINAKQPKITASGLLKGDGNGNITAAEESQVELVELVGGENINVNGNVISTKAFPCAPNLLEDWYFPNPVDQRNGKIIQQGVNIYRDSALETLIGPAAYACPVVELTSTYAKVQDAKITSSYYYATPGNVVRGYTGTNTYTIDRWKTDNTVTVIDGGITVERAGAYYLLVQYFEDSLVKAIAGKTVTYSALTTDGLFTGTTTCPTDVSAIWDSDNAVQGNLLMDIYGNANGKKCFRLYSTVDGTEATIIAAKLELGSVQTLAHQDANGSWVLNEIPNYGEQLCRCQRYLRPAGTQFITSQASGNIYGSVVMINSYPMRAVPSIVNANYVGMEVREVTGGVAGTITNVFTPGIQGNFTVQLSGTSMTNYVYIDPTGFNPLLSAEL